VSRLPRRLVEAGLAVMLVCMPVSISGTQVGLALAALGAAAEVALTRRLPRTPLDAPIGALLAITLASAALADAPAESLRRFSGSWIILTFYLAAGWLGEPSRLQRFLRLLLPSALALGAIGIAQHYTGWNVFGSGGGGTLHSLAFGDRTVFFPRGGFSHYQTYANVFFLVFCLAVGLALGGGPAGRLPRLAAAGFLGVVVVYTFTRGIWLSLLGALAIFCWVFARRAALAAAAIGAAALLLVLLVPSSLRTRALSMGDAGANVERLLLWETTWNMVRDRPLLGFGIGAYRAAQDAYVREEIPMLMTRTHAHNIWLQAAVERGVLGMLALAWLMAALAREALAAVRRLPAGGAPHALAVAALAGLSGFLIDGLVQNNFGDSQATTVFWLVAAVAVACRRAADQAAPLPAGAAA
jgi:O-antigen ligase